MGLLSFFGLQKRHSLSGPGVFGFGSHTKSGVPVSIDTSFGLPPLWAAYRILGDTMASMPFEVFEKKRDGVFPAEDLPLYGLLTSEPNFIHDAYTWKEKMQVDLESYGNAFSRIHRDRDGVVYALEWYPPESVTVLLNTDRAGAPRESTIKYKIQVIGGIIGGKEDIFLDYDEMIHLRVMSKDGIMGRSPITACAEALGMMLAAQLYGASYYANGAKPAAILTVLNQTLTKEQQQQILTAWNNAHTGATKSGGTALLYGGATYQALSSNPADAEFVKTMKLSSEQIAQIFGIPQHLLGNLERSTNNNIEHQSIDFVRNCIRPRAKRWEVEFNRKLFLTPKNKRKYFVRYNLDSLLRGDTAARGDFYTQMVNMGAMTRNEVRSHENMNRIEGLDEILTPLNMFDPNHPPQENLKAKQNGKVAA